MAGAFFICLLGFGVRRALGGAVMTTNGVFYPAAVILLLAVLYECYALWRTRRASALHRLIAPWRWQANAVLELAVPALILTILHFYSPRGEYAALSGPSILLFPLIILVSILRLRPRFTLLTGCGAALVHWSLGLHAVATGAVPEHHGPVVLSYGVLLLLIGFAGAGVARAVRRYVIEAVDEATERERAGRRLASMERDLDVARDIQSGLLPHTTPAYPGLDIAGMNRPAEKTGGDYYDWQELPDGRILIVMADVTGHGIGPALVMAVCRAYSRASAPLDSSPASLLQRLNGLLSTDLRGGRFITLALAIIDPAGRVELASAGHGPNLLFRSKDRAVEQFGGDGLPLAVMADETYGPSRTFHLAKGDVLVLLTDGVFERANRAGQQFGTQRLADAVATAAPLPARQILDSIDRAANEFAAGAAQNDDVTIVVIKRT